MTAVQIRPGVWQVPGHATEVIGRGIAGKELCEAMARFDMERAA